MGFNFKENREEKKEVTEKPHNNDDPTKNKTDLKKVTAETNFYNDSIKREKKEAGVEKIACRNEDLDGKNHPVTGVPFRREKITIDEKEKEGVFPKFESQYDVALPEEYYKKTDKEQFEQCNYTISDAAEIDPKLKKQFKEELSDFEDGVTPEGYIWHHSENPGEFQLVDEYTHNKTGHTGGRSIWGGGSECR